MDMRWKLYSNIKRLLFQFDLVPKNEWDEQRFYNELIKILEL